jgi:uncharacterized membrane-anchored protein YhcB (DUF1043 family)
MVEMFFIGGGIGIFVGIAVGYLASNFNNKEIDTDTAIAYLKEKGYWTTINVNPKQNEK